MRNSRAPPSPAENAARVGLDFEHLPVVVQFNKRDLPDIYSDEEIRGRWRATSWPLVFAVALSGAGVRETFAALLGAVYRPIDRAYGLHSAHGVDAAALVSLAAGSPAAVRKPTPC